MELWVPVKGFEGKYRVSSEGRIRHLKKEKELIPFKDKYGYMCVNLVVGKKERKRLFVHRIVFLSFKGGNETLTVNHKDEDKTNNNLSNLELITAQENIRKWNANHRGVHPRAKLNKKDVIKLRELVRNGEAVSFVAKQFSVSLMTVYHIKNRKTWRHI